ncbi:hypothetical protein ETD86_17135 [Nonomuraea turkmeniaca]|uniref:Uncharacterized protein n=1 Tax=Nonomuraea turkmeniaca TaxID=103838 RepID=A0A5S4FJQ8_9ACTN|nr:hypothetical protein [Nonomuraea turkmeniaca]TMR20977.1 hypothetical protein ETD86_17135 [Nonomuraea turkmeniaca]
MKIKHTLVPLGSGVAATALLDAALAGSAQAAPDVKPSESVSSTTAKGIAAYWLENNGAALKAATYVEEDTTDVDKLVSTGTASTDTKAGSVAPTGTTTSTPFRCSQAFHKQASSNPHAWLPSSRPCTGPVRSTSSSWTTSPR